MAGHSKWANIKHKKSANDAKKAKLNTKLIKEIYISTKLGGTDESANPRLRIAKINAKSANISKDTIERAIQKASGANSIDYQIINYEGKGPFGVAVIIETMTDNINRTVSLVRSVFTKYGGQMLKNGSLAYIFDRKGVFILNSIDKLSEDDFTLKMIDLGAEEVEKENSNFIIVCNIEYFGDIQREIENLKLNPLNAELRYFPKIYHKINDTEKVKFHKFLESMEDLDDIQHVYHNLE